MRCVIVDDSADFIDAARGLLEHDGLTVVGVASSSADAIHCIQDLRPDVVLVDVNLGEENGFELAEQIHRSVSPAPPPVVMISTDSEQDLIDLIATTAVLGFVAKLALSGGAVRDLVAGSARLEEGGHG
jgi:DNA-binding NarL/FixJ family response regulator